MHLRPAFAIALALALAAPVTPAGAEQLPREEWADYLAEALPSAFCAEGAFFSECFAVTPAECLNKARLATGGCIAGFTPLMPAMLNLPDDGGHWGGEIGACAGSALEGLLRESYISTDKRCSDPSYWVPAQ